jgi:hypothetical protein
MGMELRSRFPSKTLAWAGLVIRVLLLVLPAVLLAVGCVRTTGRTQSMLALGAIFELVVWGLTFLGGRNFRLPLGSAIVTLYLGGLAWLWLAAQQSGDWYLHLAQAVLLVVPLTVFAAQSFLGSGAPALRRARVLATRLAGRKEWPADLGACRNLPEVKAFHEALYLDATPALALLQHPRLPVRVAALAALEFRKNWRSGQAEFVLEVAQKSPEPAVRAGAVTALANLDDRILVETLASFLRDSSWKVRRAATEALLWDSERRWPWIRHSVRQCLGEGAHKDDGPLQYDGQPLTPEAVADLQAWAAEKGVLGLRAAQTLGVHYAKLLHEQPEEELVRDLQRQLANPQTPASLRIELARLLQTDKHLDRPLLEGLLNSANPAPLRLMAAEALLGAGPHAEATAALYDVARLPNREIALNTAGVVQRCLGVDLGLALGQALPEVHSRHAAEVTRRVMLWAGQREGLALNGAASRSVE